MEVHMQMIWNLYNLKTKYLQSKNSILFDSWWRHRIETFPALLALCAGNSPVTGHGEFLSQRPVTRSFDVFFDLGLNKRLSKQSKGWWFETPLCSLWRLRNDSFEFHTMCAWNWYYFHKEGWTTGTRAKRPRVVGKVVVTNMILALSYLPFSNMDSGWLAAQLQTNQKSCWETAVHWQRVQQRN